MANCFDDIWSKAEVGHEMAVHDVEVKPICAGAMNAPKFSIEAGKIGGEKRWGNDEIPRGCWHRIVGDWMG